MGFWSLACVLCITWLQRGFAPDHQCPLLSHPGPPPPDQSPLLPDPRSPTASTPLPSDPRTPSPLLLAAAAVPEQPPATPSSPIRSPLPTAPSPLLAAPSYPIHSRCHRCARAILAAAYTRCTITIRWERERAKRWEEKMILELASPCAVVCFYLPSSFHRRST